MTDQATLAHDTSIVANQAIRQDATIEDWTFEIEFLDPGAHAFAFG
jgi:hypothetical protein